MKISNIKSFYGKTNNNTPVFEKRRRYKNTDNSCKTINVSSPYNIFNDGFIYQNTFTRENDTNFKTIIYDTNASGKIFNGKKNVELSKCTNKDSAQLEFKLNKTDSSTCLRFYAPNSMGSVGGCEFNINENGKTKKISMFWEYPRMRYHIDENKEDMKTLRKSLSILQKTILSDEYKQDFGNTKSLNYQLKHAIGYLDYKIGY